ncbi:MAG: DNA recombination/repair protein RecA, partial [Legionellales bacterium]|nr:DNA recombination/repair protein RecA [Legionellales bacterium]
DSEIIHLATTLGFIEKSGAWYSHNGEKIGQGKDNVRAYLQANRDLAANLEQKIRAELLSKKAPATQAQPEEMFDTIDD